MMVAQDDELRDLLAQADPLGAGPLAAEAATTAALLDRVLEATADQAPGTEATADQAAGAPQRSWLQRHWQGSLLVAASVATLALATPVLAPGLLVVSGGDDSTAVSATDSAAAETAMAGVDSEDAASGQRLVRSGSLLVGTDDAASQRDAFVATVTGFGGRVVSESVVVQGGGAGYPADAAVTDFMGNYPSYPW